MCIRDREKGADMLPDIIKRSISETEGALNILILGSGNLHLEHVLKEIKNEYFVNFAMDLGCLLYTSRCV